MITDNKHRQRELSQLRRGTCGLNTRKLKKEGDSVTDSAPALVANVS
jgi:hypothetical protein